MNLDTSYILEKVDIQISKYQVPQVINQADPCLEIPATSHFRAFPSNGCLSSERVALIKNWIADCKENHSMCKKKADPPMPTRSIDVQPQNPGLVLTTGMTSPYAALSHCWGLSEDNPFAAKYATTDKTVESRMNGMILDEMPRTFQDAVYVTRLLGLRYLWIDSR